MAKKSKTEIAAQTDVTEETSELLGAVQAAEETAPYVQLDPNEGSKLTAAEREAATAQVRVWFKLADNELAALEKRADPRFSRARIKLGETVGALR